jgi:hypothetical protein
MLQPLLATDNHAEQKTDEQMSRFVAALADETGQATKLEVDRWLPAGTESV